MNKPDDKIQALIQANPFVQTLAQLQKGGFITDCTEKMGQTIAAVKRTGKKGKLVLTLDIHPDDTGEVRTVDITGDARPKLPERKKGATTFFVVGEQSLSVTGVPDQPELDFEPRVALPAGAPTAVTKMPQAANN